jgi:hypothetical protein
MDAIRLQAASHARPRDGAGRRVLAKIGATGARLLGAALSGPQVELFTDPRRPPPPERVLDHLRGCADPIGAARRVAAFLALLSPTRLWSSLGLHQPRQDLRSPAAQAERTRR